MADYTQLTEEDLWARVNVVSGVERINVLAELGDRAFEAGEFGCALALFEEARNSVEESDDRQWFAEILYVQGASAFHCGELTLAVDSYGQAAQVFVEIGIQSAAVHALLCQADAYSAVGDLERCLTIAREAGVLAESANDRALAGEAALLEAYALQRRGSDQEAVNAYSASSLHFQRAGCHERAMRVNDLVAAALLRLGQTDAALSSAREGLALAHRCKADASLAHYRLAQVLQRTGEHAMAVEEVEAARRGYRNAGDLAGEAASQRLRGQALIDSHRYTDARAAFEQATTLFFAGGMVRQALLCQVDQALAWQILGEHEEAERINRYLMEAFADLDQDSTDAQFSAVRLLDNLIAQGQYEECRIAAEAAMVLWPEGSTATTPSYREFLGRWTLALHRTGRVGYAVAMATHVIKRAPKDRDSFALAYCYEVRGRYRAAHRQAGALADLLRAAQAHLALAQAGLSDDLAPLLVQLLGELPSATPAVPSASAAA